MTTSDPSRSPAGTESAWAYTHVSRGLEWDSRFGRPCTLPGLEDILDRQVEVVGELAGFGCPAQG
jgi:hypothetical protein